MASVNKVILVGRLGKDPELKSTQNGKCFAKFSLATQEGERTEWHSIVAWEKTAELAASYLAKGSQVYIEGRLATRTWDDEQGNKKYMTEIVASTLQFLDSKKKEKEEDIPF